MRAKFLRPILVAGFCALLLSGQAWAEVLVGQSAPALTATALDGKKFDLAASKGKVVIIHFWATWCVACREEMPALEAVWRQYRGKGVEILAVSGDRPRARGAVDQVMQYFSFPAAMFSDLDKNGFGTPSAIPITYVIDKEGVLQNVLTPDVMSLTQAKFGDIVKNLVDAKQEPKLESKDQSKPDVKPDDKK